MEVNHMHEGIHLAMRDDREKRSEALGRCGALGGRPGEEGGQRELKLLQSDLFLPACSVLVYCRNVMYHGDSRITALPPYLTVQVGAEGEWVGGWVATRGASGLAARWAIAAFLLTQRPLPAPDARTPAAAATPAGRR
jgi:hypothetical protein